jgi:opacity protein-like surface antigen
MKKIMLTGLILAVVVVFGTVRSAYCASDSETQTGRLSIGLEEDYIFDRDMEHGDISMPTDVTIVKKKMEVKDLGMTMLHAGYQVSPNLNVYANLGVTNGNGGFDMKSNGTWTGGTFTEKENYEEDNSFAWGAGLKLCFPLGNNWIFGADAKYLEHENDYSGKRSVRFFDSGGTLLPGLSVNDSSNKWGSATISEWHVAPFIARDFGVFVPYIGVKYSDLHIDMKESSDALIAKDNWGAFVGADFKFNKNFSLNLEGRFIDETAMSLAAVFTF